MRRVLEQRGIKKAHQQFGLRRISEPKQMRRNYVYPTTIIPGHSINIYKETVPDVYADSDTYSTGP